MIIRWLSFFVILLIPSVSCLGIARATAGSGASAVVVIAPSSSVASTNKQVATATSPTIATATDYQNSTTMECYHVASDAAVNTVVCAMKPPVLISNIISVIALIISFGGLLYGLRKDRKARLQSIEDDYWIRKVISPIALEPLIKKITETVSSIPDDRQSSCFNEKACDEFGKKFQSDWSQFSCSMDALALLNKEVRKTAMSHVSNIEDEMLRYCSNNVAGKIGADGGCMSKTDLQEIINAEMLAIMNCIKQYQISKI